MGRVLANTTRALTLKEANLPAVQYIPREDADMSLLERTVHKTHCPHKGDAAYYTIRADGGVAENAVWTYEDAYPAVAGDQGPARVLARPRRSHRRAAGLSGG